MNKLQFELRKSKVLLKQPDIKINKYYYKPSVKELFNYGVVNLNKPRGPKSRAIASKVKNILEIARAGYAGTLDPMVSGVLPIFLARGTKLSGIVSMAGKVYRGKMRLHKEVSNNELKKAFKHFTGVIEQLPPKLSAVKREVRKRKIYWFDILSRKHNLIEFEVGCEAGTYIRKLCHDLGEYLSIGANMIFLVRTQAGPFKLKDAITVSDLINNYKKYLKSKDPNLIFSIIQPVYKAVEHLPKVWVDDPVLDRLKHGSPVFAPGIVALEDSISVGDLISIMSLKSKVAAIGWANMNSRDMLEKRRGLAIKTDIVLIS